MVCSKAIRRLAGSTLASSRGLGFGGNNCSQRQHLFQNLDALGGFHLRQFAGLGFSVYDCKHFSRAARLFQNLDAVGWFDLRQFAGLGFSPYYSMEFSQGQISDICALNRLVAVVALPIPLLLAIRLQTYRSRNGRGVSRGFQRAQGRVPRRSCARLRWFAGLPRRIRSMRTVCFLRTKLRFCLSFWASACATATMSPIGDIAISLTTPCTVPMPAPLRRLRLSGLPK